MTTNSYGKIYPLRIVMSQSFRRPLGDVEDGEAMADDPFGGSHVQTPLVLCYSPMSQRRPSMYELGAMRLKDLIRMLPSDGYAMFRRFYAMPENWTDHMQPWNEKMGKAFDDTWRDCIGRYGGGEYNDVAGVRRSVRFQ